MIILNSVTWNKNFSSFSSNCGEVSARFTVMKFLHIIVILFLHRCRLTCEMKSYHGFKSWNFSPGWKSPQNQPLRWSFFPTQHILLIFLVFSGDSKLFFLQLFRFSVKLQLATKSYWKDWWHLPIFPYIIEGCFL